MVAGALILLAGLAQASVATAASDDSARQLAAAIERRAETTSFADLERFGAAASRQNGREALRRLHHVAFVLLNQSEFDRFEHWNSTLAAKAQQAGDRRYADIARIDELKSRYDRGDTSVRAQIDRIADTDRDWFARVHAISAEALILNTEREAGQALKRMFEAEALIPRGDPDTAMAESDIWGTIGISLMQLNDLDGAAAAFEKSDFVWADKTYPGPTSTTSTTWPSWPGSSARPVWLATSLPRITAWRRARTCRISTSGTNISAPLSPRASRRRRP
jgi:hypothetical protein